MGFKKLTKIENELKMQRTLSPATIKTQIKTHFQGKFNMLFYNKFLVKRNERGLLFKEGDFITVLEPGTYRYLGYKHSVEIYDLAKPEFEHRLVDFLLKEQTELINRYFTVVDLTSEQVAFVYQEAKLVDILSPNTRKLYWQGFITIKIETVNIKENFIVDTDKMTLLLHSKTNVGIQCFNQVINKFEVPEYHVGLLYLNEQLHQVIAAGTYGYWKFNRKIEAKIYDCRNIDNIPEKTDLLLNTYADKLEEYLAEIELSKYQIALMYKNGHLVRILAPDVTYFYWKNIGDITVEIIDISEVFVIDKKLATTLVHAHMFAKDCVYHQEIPDKHIGLLYVNGEYVQTLPPGLHAYWIFNRKIKIDIWDLRLQATEVSGQEILTKDKVSLRINLSANYQIEDALQMVKLLEKPVDYLYRELQFGIRAVVGTRTLDELLENKNTIDESVFQYIQKKMTDTGIVVRNIGVKDIILPGEMKTILGSIIEAEKLAQANIIRRREETAATRSLLNTAKVMENNPTALRLKELETLEKITEKVDNISVYGGLDGLLKELVQIKTGG